MANTKTIGEKTEGMVLAALLRAGKVVLLPFGDNQRYDLVVDDGGGRFTRIQCKTGRIIGNGIRFDTCSSQSHRGKGKQSYTGQIEMFGVYSPDLDKVYLVPIGVCGLTAMTLLLNTQKGRNGYTIYWAKDYELEMPS